MCPVLFRVTVQAVWWMSQWWNLMGFRHHPHSHPNPGIELVFDYWTNLSWGTDTFNP
jgi:hypothetical protein